MSLGTVTLIVAIVAAALTFFLYRRTIVVRSLPISFLQNFAGILFLFSGWVKVVDPLGTAYKMEQYFAEFEATFADTTFSFLAPIFPVLGQVSVSFAVGMIVLELVMGLMLILGTWKKVTAWAFFLLVGFFTLLTGFTFLTGYVPDGVNFFSFGQWSAFKETNMKVTDCGCFGDFIKLKPQVSFMKDLVLLVPAVLFLVRNRDMHQLFTGRARQLIVGASLPIFLLYSYSNYVWDLPHLDFRPFKEGVDIAAQKALEAEALANIEVLGFSVENKATGEKQELSYDDYMSRFKEFPADSWNIEQIQSEPEIEPSKISEFEISHLEGYDVTEDILGEPAYLFLLVAQELKGTEQTLPETYRDTVFQVDTLLEENAPRYVKRVKNVAERQANKLVYQWDASYLERWTEGIVPVLKEAEGSGMKVAVVSRIANPDKLEHFVKAIGTDWPIYQADDILLKTIIRSNPGIVLLKEGKIIAKWHYRKFPGSWDEVHQTIATK